MNKEAPVEDDDITHIDYGHVMDCRVQKHYHAWTIEMVSFIHQASTLAIVEYSSFIQQDEPLGADGDAENASVRERCRR